MEREKTCCFSGHRPERLPWGTNEDDPRCLELKQRIRRAAEQAFELGYRHFICGMARGCDLYFCQIVLELRGRKEGVTVEAAIPCQTQAASWPEPDRTLREQLLSCCDLETMVQHHYSRGCMIRRNRYMVEHSRRLIVVYNGEASGGTANTLLYAIRKGLETDIIELET